MSKSNTTNPLIDYIYDFAWHYGRYFHLDDAEVIIARVKEVIQLPEEFLASKESNTDCSVDGGQPALIRKDVALDELKKMYDYGDENGYSNSELSRIGSCIKKIADIKIYSPTPQQNEL